MRPGRRVLASAESVSFERSCASSRSCRSSPTASRSLSFSLESFSTRRSRKRSLTMDFASCIVAGCLISRSLLGVADRGPVPTPGRGYPRLQTLRHDQRGVVAELAPRVEQGAFHRLDDPGRVLARGGGERRPEHGLSLIGMLDGELCEPV